MSAEAKTPVPEPERLADSSIHLGVSIGQVEERHHIEASDNQFARDQRWLNVKHWIVVCFAILGAILLAPVAVTFVGAILAPVVIILIHQFAPESIGWLSEERQNEIYVGIQIIGGGAVGAMSLMSAQFIQKLIQERKP